VLTGDHPEHSQALLHKPSGMMDLRDELTKIMGR
jgi:hypothetical protein